MKTIVSVAGLFIFFLWLAGCSQESKDSPKITSKKLSEHVKFLASKELKGRLAGSQGYNKAARYVADEFKALKLSDAGYDDYFQRFTLEYNRIKAASYSAVSGDTTYSYHLGKDYICRGFSGSGALDAPVVFCGYGLSRPEKGYDDFAGLDVKGKIVMEFKSDPHWRLDGEQIGYRSLRKKVEAARKHGAVGIIYVSRPNRTNPQKPIGSVMHGEGAQDQDFPQIHISLEAAEDLFRNSPHSLKALQTAIDKHKAPRSVSLPGRARIMVEADYDPRKNSMNVVGMLEGDSLKNEYLVIGAHLDHVGSQAGKVYFPGANDNASGVASLLEMARAFASKEYRPARSVIFVAFSAEEQGLNGARYFVDHSPVNSDRIVAMMNLDCVAHGDSMVVGGGKSFPRLYKIATQQDAKMKGMVIDRTWGGGGADATPFYEQGIPTLYFATQNSYTHLHLPSDQPVTLNDSLHRYLTRVAFKTAEEIAEGEYSPPSGND